MEDEEWLRESRKRRFSTTLRFDIILRDLLKKHFPLYQQSDVINLAVKRYLERDLQIEVPNQLVEVPA